MPRKKKDEEVILGIGDTTETPVEKKRPRVNILERRLSNPFGEPSATIRFKRKDITGHWFNESVRHGQIYRVKQLGWEHVTKDMIADMETLGPYALSPDNYIVRGPRGEEFLMFMPTADYQAIQKAKVAENNRRLSNPNATRADAIEAFGQTNPELAEDIERQNVVLTGNVTTKVARMERTAEYVEE